MKTYLSELSLPYKYYADGSRARKLDPNSNAVTTYVDFNGMRLTDIDQHNGATEYFYANGQKVAMTQPYEHRLHTHGVMNGDWNELNFPVDRPHNADGSDYTVQAGDMLCFRQYNTSSGGGAVGGPGLFYSDGSMSAWQVSDTNGSTLNQFGAQNVWTQRCADIRLVARALG